MYRFYLAAVDLLPSALLLAPVCFVLNKVYWRNAGKSILYYLFSCYLAEIYILVGLPNVIYIRPELNLNVIPLIGMITDWKNSTLNILLFIPMGMSLPLLWNRFRTRKHTILWGLGASLAIEFLQIFTYRATDINDVITNTAGTYLGFLCTQILLRKSSALTHMVNEKNTGELWIILTTVVLIMFFAYPFVSAALWDTLLS